MTEPSDDPFGDPTPREPELIRNGRYDLPHPITGEPVPRGWMRVTNLTKMLGDTYLLDQWKLRMVAKGIGLKDDLHALAAATPFEDRATLQQVAEDAMTAAGAAEGRNKGSALHSFTESLDRNLAATVVPAKWQPPIGAYLATMRANGIQHLRIENTGVLLDSDGGPVVSGTFDRLGMAPGWSLPRILDLKTAPRLDFSALEMAIQLAIYSRFSHLWNKHSRTYTPMPYVDQRRGLIIHLPSDGSTCTLHNVDLVRGWRAFRTCLEVLETRKWKGLLTPYAAPAADPFGRVFDELDGMSA